MSYSPTCGDQNALEAPGPRPGRCSAAGVGRTRFFSRYSRSIAPRLHPPRWLFNLALNDFLDQDTYLLATQQEVGLKAAS